MRIVMMGTGPFAVPSYQALIDASRHDVIALVTRPVPPAKGRRKDPVNPMLEAANRFEQHVFSPASINDETSIEKLRTLDADLFVVCDYGQILSSNALAAAKLGGINLHGSLLPKYRGAAPINWTLYHGETQTGVTVIHMTPGLDAGPILTSREIPIETSDDAISLETKLADVGQTAVIEAVEMLDQWSKRRDANDSSPGVIQDESLASRARRLRKSDGAIDWSRSVTQIRNQVRAFKAWPRSFSFLPSNESAATRIVIEEMEVVTPPAGDVEAPTAQGTIVKADQEGFWILTGEGVASVTSLQPAGKRVMSFDEFLRGHAVTVGSAMQPTADKSSS